MASFHEPKTFQWVHAPGLRGLVGLSTSRRRHKVTGAKINRVAVEITGWTRMEKRLIHSKFSKNSTRFLHNVESYATTNIP